MEVWGKRNGTLSSESLNYAKDNNITVEEESPTLVNDDTRDAPSMDDGHVGVLACSCQSVDSDDDSVSGSVPRQTRRHRRVKLNSQSERSGRPTARFDSRWRHNAT